MTTTEEDDLSYASAVEELDEILAELEDDSLDVDILGDRVKRASELISFCRNRITSAKTQVEQSVADLEQSETSEAADE